MRLYMYKSAIPAHYLLNQWYHINQTCIDILLGEGASVMVCLFDLILYFPSTILQLNRDGSSWIEPVLS